MRGRELTPGRGNGNGAALLDAVAALRDRDEQLRKLSRAVEQSPAMILVTDTEGNIEYVNPEFCRVTGYSPEDVLGRTPRILKSGAMSQDVYHGMWSTILAGSEWRGELLNRKKDGDLYWELASISPVRDEDGCVTHFVAV